MEWKDLPDADKQYFIANRVKTVASSFYKLQTSPDKNVRELAMSVAASAVSDLIAFYELGERELVEEWKEITDGVYWE